MRKREEMARVFFDVSKYSFGAGLIGSVVSQHLSLELLAFVLAVGLVSFALGWYIFPEED